MAKSKAFVQLNREWTNSEEWLREPFDKVRAWIDLFCLASYKDGDICKRGQLVTSERALANRWHWKHGQVRRYLLKLEADGRIERSSNRNTNRSGWGSTITIVKYDDYQMSASSKPSSDRSSSQSYKNNINNINNLSNMPDGIKAELLNLFGDRTEALIEDVQRYYKAHPEKDFPGWPIAVAQFNANQARWDRPKKKRRRTVEEILAEEEQYDSEGN